MGVAGAHFLSGPPMRGRPRALHKHPTIVKRHNMKYTDLCFEMVKIYQGRGEAAKAIEEEYKTKEGVTPKPAPKARVKLNKWGGNKKL